MHAPRYGIQRLAGPSSPFHSERAHIAARPFFSVTRASRFATPLSGGPPRLAPGPRRPPVSPAGGRLGCGPAPALLRGARACCATRQVQTRPSARRLASRIPLPYELQKKRTGAGGSSRCLPLVAPVLFVLISRVWPPFRSHLRGRR